MLGVVAGIISALAFFPYFVSILKGTTKPIRVTWWVWSWLGILLFFSYKASGAHDTLLVPFIYMITPVLVAILSIKYGCGGLTAVDVICFVSSLIATVFWLFSGSSEQSLFLFLVIDFIGLIPTIRNTFHHPEQESSPAWLLMAAANFLNLIVACNEGFVVAVYPLYLFLSGTLVFCLSLRKARGF